MIGSEERPKNPSPFHLVCPSAAGFVLRHYNCERLHQGCSNLGERPIDTIKEYLQRLAAVRAEAQ